MKSKRTLAAETLKRIIKIKSFYMENIFTPKESSRVRYNNMAKWINARIFGAQSLKSLRPKIFSGLLSDIKLKTSFHKFNKFIKIRFGPRRSCNFSMFLSRTEQKL